MQDNQLEIRCSIEHGYHFIQPCSVRVFDGPDAEVIRSRVLDLIEDEECPKVAIDLDGIALVCTAAWGKLMVLQQTISRESGTLAVVNVHETVKEALRTMKLDRLINICDSVDALAEPPEAIPMEVAPADEEAEEIAFEEADDEVEFEEANGEVEFEESGDDDDDVVVFGEEDKLVIIEEAGDDDEGEES